MTHPDMNLIQVFLVFTHAVFSAFGGSLWEALQEPSWPELPLHPLPPGWGGGGGEGRDGDQWASTASTQWAQKWEMIPI